VDRDVRGVGELEGVARTVLAGGVVAEPGEAAERRAAGRRLHVEAGVRVRLARRGDELRVPDARADDLHALAADLDAPGQRVLAGRQEDAGVRAGAAHGVDGVLHVL